MSIIFTVYNIRRAMSILGVKELISRLKAQKGVNKAQKTGILRCFDFYVAPGEGCGSMKSQHTSLLIHTVTNETKLYK